MFFLPTIILVFNTIMSTYNMIIQTATYRTCHLMYKYMTNCHVGLKVVEVKGHVNEKRSRSAEF